jgi:23S rRNA pseudouridine1911/1915/1917 synthase
METFNPTPAYEFKADPIHDGLRLDRFLHVCMRWRSRTSIRKDIEAGRVTQDGRTLRPAQKVRTGDRFLITPERRDVEPFDPESVTVDFLFEDDVLAAINKPAGIVVHPTGTHPNNTLMDVLIHLYRDRRLPDGRPAEPCLAHRIDRNTSGVLLISTDPNIRSALQRKFEFGGVKKEYRAIVHGLPEEDGFTIDLPIGYDETSHIRIKRGIRHDTGLPARTHVEVLDRFDGFSHLSIRPVSGRTHQIRVHLAAVGLPIIADHMYSATESLTGRDLTGEGDDIVITRQALHAHRLSVTHPLTEESVCYEAPYPADMTEVLRRLKIISK